MHIKKEVYSKYIEKKVYRALNVAYTLKCRNMNKVKKWSKCKFLFQLNQSYKKPNQ